jgi:hypothetical protein
MPAINGMISLKKGIFFHANEPCTCILNDSKKEFKRGAAYLQPGNW